MVLARVNSGAAGSGAILSPHALRLLLSSHCAESLQSRAENCLVRIRTVDCIIGRVGELRRVAHSVEASVLKIRLYRTHSEVPRAACREDVAE
jgi:hypothetical protein